MIKLSILMLVLSGCAQTMMVHNTKTSIDRDNYECTREAEQRASNWGAQGNIFMMKDWVYECLSHRGWRIQ